MKVKFWYLVTLGVLIFDQFTKIITYGLHQSFIDGLFSINSVQNTGAGFSMLLGATWLFVILATVAIVAMLLFDFLNTKDYHFNAWYYIGFTLLIGGIFGNLIDRIAFGYVRDFVSLDFMTFPIFNIADIALCVGTACIIVWLIFFCGKPSKKIVIEQNKK